VSDKDGRFLLDVGYLEVTFSQITDSVRGPDAVIQVQSAP
jgi:hypothetical protein